MAEFNSPQSYKELSLGENNGEADFLSAGIERMNLKRGSSDRLSVEGSPLMNPQLKRIDDTSTPLNRGSIGSLGSSSSSGCATPQLVLRIKRKDLNPIQVIKEDHVVEEVSKREASGQKQVLIVSPSGDDEHLTGDGHQENALRTTLLCGDDGCLRRSALENSLVWAPEDQEYCAPIADLLRCHEYAYLKHIQDKCDAAANLSGEDVSGGEANTPSFYAGVGMLDSDTPVGPSSLIAARRFCGAAMFAVDCLLGEDAAISRPPGDLPSSLCPVTRSFVIGRPPGHHCGPNGAVVSEHFCKRPEMASSGFCLLNTAAVAGAYARYKYGRVSSQKDLANGFGCRVAIVDIDVHHGNGTEACVRNLVPHEEALPLPSSWAPRWTQSYKPWLDESDAKDVFFGSISLVAGSSFYPGSGNDSISEHDAMSGGSNVVNVALSPIGPGPWDLKGRAAVSEKKRAELCALASAELKTKVSESLLPRLDAFAPDLLIISAGFDAHYDDMYHYLTEQDFHWVTKQLCEITTSRGGRVLSVLEGGYSLSSPLPKPSRKKERSADMPRRETRNTPMSAGTCATASKATSLDSPLAVETDVPIKSPLCILPGDGGLVKGVMAHVAALAGREDWL
jgi:acetoin utilization deacetylase AcuC-like enzyme